MRWWKPIILPVILACMVWYGVPWAVARWTKGPDTRPYLFADGWSSQWPSEMTYVSAGTVRSRAWIGIRVNGLGSSAASGRCSVWYWDIALWGSAPWKSAKIFDRGALIHTQTAMGAAFYGCHAWMSLSEDYGGRRAVIRLVAPTAKVLRIVVEDVAGNIFEYEQDLSRLEAEKQDTLRFLGGER